MIWLFHRCGEYLTCEARTCLDDAGFEILIERQGRLHREWYADEQQLMQRWQNVTLELRRGGWGELRSGRY
jgi:hypothetical protein